MSSNISAAEVNKLRKKTGAGIMDCKKALVESNGDIEAAIDFLRKKGAKVAESRKDRAANEGVIITKLSKDKKTGILLELNCETDFVAKNADFVDFANKIAQVALENNIQTLEDLLNASLEGSVIKDLVLDMTGKIGEKISLRKYETLQSECITAYTHSNNKLGVLVALNKGGDNVSEAGKDVAMQIAAMNPVAVSKDEVDETIVQRELEIAKDQIKAEGKPEALAEKIAQGKLNKFFKDSTLLSQAYVKDGGKSVEQFLNEVVKGLTVTSFIRVQLGDQ